MTVAGNYSEIVDFETGLGATSVHVRTKPGFPNWHMITPAQGLLAETAQLPKDAHILVIGAGPGALAVVLAKRVPDGEVWCLDTNYIALRMSHETLQANGVQNAHVHFAVSVLPAQAATFDIVVMELPKGRQLARRWLVEAHAALHTDGKLYLAGPNALGAKSVIKDLEALFGNVALPGYKQRNRVALGFKRADSPAAPAWAGEPGIAPGTWSEFSVNTEQFATGLYTLPGVFAYDKLDAGTALLLSHLQVPAGAHVLDVGCGCGVIGLFAGQAGAGAVDMVDVNLLAVAAAQANLARPRFHAISTQLRALPSDVLGAVADRKYDLIVTNPPFHTGKEVVYDVAHAIIEQAHTALSPGGHFWLVANKFIRYQEVMARLFGNVTTVAEDKRYHLLLASG